MFGINNSKDRFYLLQENFEELKKFPLNISLAETACSNAWHLIDWVLEEKKKVDSTLTKEKFRIQVYNEYPKIKILHDLVNTFKHKELSSPKVKIVKTKTQGGAYSSAYSKGFDVPRLEIHFENNEKIDVDDLLAETILYWKQKLNL